MKDSILGELKKKASGYVSGEQLSSIFGISRTAIWKHINQLKQQGYDIESSSRKGYRLVCVPDILSTHEITENLATQFMGRKIICLDSIDSTSNYAKKLANEGYPEGTVVVANKQTSGRGRLGREWSSLPGMGVWMSVVLKPLLKPEKAQIFTLAAAVAVAHAIHKTAGVSATIKWPNDIVLQERKVCGILTEMAAEIDRINYIVIGIGVNVGQGEEDFPAEFRDRAVSLKDFCMKKTMPLAVFVDRSVIKRSLLTAEILNELEIMYDYVTKGEQHKIVDAWKRCSATLGKEVKVIQSDGSFTAKAIDIKDDGRLVVACADGTIKEIVSGEVSVRGLMGYV